MVEGEYDEDTRTTEGDREGNTGASHVPEVGGGSPGYLACDILSAINTL